MLCTRLSSFLLNRFGSVHDMFVVCQLMSYSGSSSMLLLLADPESLKSVMIVGALLGCVVSRKQFL